MNIAHFVARGKAPFTTFPNLVDLHLDILQKRQYLSHLCPGHRSICEGGPGGQTNKHTLSCPIPALTCVWKSKKMVYMTYVEDSCQQFCEHCLCVGLRNVGLTEQDLKFQMFGFSCDGASVTMEFTMEWQAIWNNCVPHLHQSGVWLTDWSCQHLTASNQCWLTWRKQWMVFTSTTPTLQKLPCTGESHGHKCDQTRQWWDKMASTYVQGPWKFGEEPAACWRWSHGLQMTTDCHL